MRTAARASWLTLVLAAVLGLTMPVAAAVAGEAAAVPSPGPRVVVAAASTHPGPVHGVVRAEVLAAEGSIAQASAPVPSAWSTPSLLVRIPAGGIAAHARPGRDAAVVGTVVGASKYYRVPLVLWVERTNAAGTWGLVDLPYAWPRTDGWIPLRGLERVHTSVHVEIDLSRHRVSVFRGDERLFVVAGATGAPASPTPPGRYVVTDRVAFPRGGSLGSFAFGISGIQPRLPAGWSGGNQLAIHGTNAPSSIGTSASAGCVRVSEPTLTRLKPLLRLGTPVVIHA